jgi:GAF domain-containing protein
VNATSENGMELRDLLSDRAFLSRAGKKRDFQQPFDALRRVTEVFATRPEDVLQELVDVAMTCCGADSAGISLEEPDGEGKPTFRWVAIAGSFSPYLEGRTPRFFSPCGTCLDSGKPHLYRVTKPYYDFLGVTAEPIIDGMLIPWEADQMRGTIWAVSHTSEEAFERPDYELLKSLSDYVAIIIRQQELDEKARQAAKAEASANRAHKLAHQINNPLQSLTNTMFLASQKGPDADAYMQAALAELAALSQRVRRLLALQYPED